MTRSTEIEMSCQLVGDARSAQLARRFLSDVLTDTAFAPCLHDAQIAVGEIVTNVVLHAHTDLTVTIRVDDSRLRIEVRDGSPLLPVRRRYDVDATTGRGLALVRQITVDSGAELLEAGGKVVWFVLERPEDQTAPQAGRPEAPHTVQTRVDLLEPAASARPPGAAEVVLIGVPPALWRVALEECDAILREMALYWADHPGDPVTRHDLGLANTARAHGLVTLDQHLMQHPTTLAAPVTVRFWVTPQESEGFAVLRRVFSSAEHLAHRSRLLRAASVAEAVALRDWVCEQVIDQVAGRAARPWSEDVVGAGLPGVPEDRVQGWDANSVADSSKAVVAADAGNRIVAISASLAAALGWRVDDLIGRRLNALVPYRLRPGHVAGHQRHLLTGESRVLGQLVQLPMLCADGSEIPCGLVITQEGTRVGFPVYVAVVSLPVTSKDATAPRRARPVHTAQAVADLTRFRVGDLVRMAGVIRSLGQDPTSLAAFADEVCGYLQGQLEHDSGERQAVLVRLYATMAFDDLPVLDQIHAERTSNRVLTGDTTCLALLGTAGSKTAWNDRKASLGNRARPLAELDLAGNPFVRALMEQTGLTAPVLLQRLQYRQPTGQRPAYGHLLLAHPEGSPLLPEQSFLAEHGVRSVLGFGGGLPMGGSFGMVLYSSAEIGPEVAAMFSTLALSIALGASARPGLPFFDHGPPTDRGPLSHSPAEHQVARSEILLTLLEGHERMAAAESDAVVQRLETADFETQRYRALAQTLQATLIPPALPTIKGLETGAFFRPSGDGSEIGGDFYDLFPTSEQRWGFVLGDVSGKGAQAAAVTALARHTVRTAAFLSPDACQVLERLHEAVTAREADGRYLTALFAFVTARPDEVVIDLALGGHPQPLVLRADGRLESVGIEGSALGLFPDPSLTQVRVVLAPGDLLLAFSDGVTEARRGIEEYGEERLRQLLGQLPERHAHEVAGLVGQASLDFQQAALHDDVAVVALRCA